MQPSRIIFVGICFKQGFEALDSRTMSGKCIDRIIDHFHYPCLKTNLYQLNFIPKISKYSRALEWVSKFDPSPSDIIVLLGKQVDKYFPLEYKENSITLPHPASFQASKNVEKYIDFCIFFIYHKILS